MDELDIYLEWLRTTEHPRHTREEELELARASASGDLWARDQLVHSCLPFVVKLVKPLFGARGTSPMDLIQEGNRGLLTAVEKFRPWEHGGSRLTTYSRWWIMQRATRHVVECAGTPIRLPVSWVKALGGLCDYQQGTLKLLYSYGPYQISHNHRGDEDDQEAVVNDDFLEDKGAPSPFAAADKAELKAQLLDLFRHLDSRSQDIMLLRMRGGTLEEVGEAHHLTRERIRQIQKAATKKLVVQNNRRGWRKNGTGA